MNISIDWDCPKCGEKLRMGMSHHRTGDKPSLFQRNCSCGFSMLWFEMKDDMIYTIDQRKDNDKN